MKTTKDDIRRWFKEGVERNATHMIVICDTFDWSDFPCYVMSDENPREIVEKRDGKNMEKVIEVYNLSMDM